MNKKRRSQKWKRINIATDGKVTTVRYSNMDLKDLSDLLYAILKKIPHSPFIMQLVLDKYNKDHESRKPEP